jgi:hypothetical protein
MTVIKKFEVLESWEWEARAEARQQKKRCHVERRVKSCQISAGPPSWHLAHGGIISRVEMVQLSSQVLPLHQYRFHLPLVSFSDKRFRESFGRSHSVCVRTMLLRQKSFEGNLQPRHVNHRNARSSLPVATGIVISFTSLCQGDSCTTFLPS